MKIPQSRKHRAIAVILLLAVVFGIYQVFFASKKSTTAITTQTVEKGTIVASVSGSGQISSANSIPVDTSVSGIVAEVYVKNGDTIEAGKPIAKLTLDQSSLQKQTAAWASYLNAINQTKTAQSAKLAADASMWSDQQSVLNAQNEVNYKNGNSQNPSTKKDYTDLEKQSIESSLIGSQKSFTASEQKYKDADAAIVAAQAAASSAYLSYQQTADTIVAPISGTVNGLTIRTGMALSGNSSGSSTGSSTTTGSSSNANSNASSQKIGVIQTDAVPALTVNASEVDITKIKENQRATITLDALPDKTFTGHVASIDTTGSVTSGVTTYPVVIVFDSEAAGIYPNMAATANIITATKDDVLTIPTSAIQTQNGISTVRVQKKGKIQSVEVTTGISSDTETEIVAGLSEGDTVVTSSAVSASSATTRSGTSASPFGASPFGGGIRTGAGGGGATFRRAQ